MPARATLLALLLFLPGATALTAEMEFPATPLEPELDSVDANLVVTASCQEVWDRTPPALGSTLEVTVDIAPADGLEVAGPAVLVLPTGPCVAGLEGETMATKPYSFRTFREAPGLTFLPVTLDATLEGGQLGEPTSASTEGEIQNGFYGAMQADADSTFQQVGAQEPATFTITLTNLGNAPTTARFALPGTGPVATTINLPPATVVGSAAHGQDNTETVTITAEVDPEFIGFLNEAIDFTVTVTTHATDEPAMAGNEATMSFLLSIRDAKGAPAPNLLFVAPALLGAALLARRRT